MALVLAALGACGPSGERPYASAGQVENASTPGMTRYAAARAADQVSFGATPALVDNIRQQGLDAWITGQFNGAPSLMNTPDWVINHVPNIALNNDWPINQFFNFAIKSEDQLRLRVTWALMQFIPVQTFPYGNAEYFNMLQRNAFGDFGEFIREFTIHPAMGDYQDNVENKPKTEQCPKCSTNENFARELMQIFTLGVSRLNPDGTVVRDSAGKLVPTYTENDVKQMTLALTGWSYAKTDSPPHRDSNPINAAYPMVPDTLPGAHDSRAKTILGRNISAGLTASQELDQVVSILMDHPNIAPFVSLRLIQHLVMSDPSPAYLSRVSAKFRNNGSGIAGDMKTVIRTILMDPEARAADVLGQGPTKGGKFREPMLWHMGLVRGLQCDGPLYHIDPLQPGITWGAGNQTPFRPPTVFSFYPPSHRTPGSKILAPEHKLLTTDELAQRITWYSQYHPVITSPVNNGPGKANCKLEPLVELLRISPQAFIDQVSLVWLRGAMSAPLRYELMEAASRPQQSGVGRNVPGVLELLLYALSSQQYGVMQ